MAPPRLGFIRLVAAIYLLFRNVPTLHRGRLRGSDGAPVCDRDGARITHDTSVTLLGRYQLENGRHAFPLPALGTVQPNINGDIPVTRYIGELTHNANRLHEDNRQLGYQFSHRFSEEVAFPSRNSTVITFKIT